MRSCIFIFTWKPLRKQHKKCAALFSFSHETHCENNTRNPQLYFHFHIKAITKTTWEMRSCIFIFTWKPLRKQHKKCAALFSFSHESHCENNTRNAQLFFHFHIKAITKRTREMRSCIFIFTWKPLWKQHKNPQLYFHFHMKAIEKTTQEMCRYIFIFTWKPLRKQHKKCTAVFSFLHENHWENNTRNAQLYFHFYIKAITKTTREMRSCIFIFTWKPLLRKQHKKWWTVFLVHIGGTENL